MISNIILLHLKNNAKQTFVNTPKMGRYPKVCFVYLLVGGKFEERPLTENIKENLINYGNLGV